MSELTPSQTVGPFLHLALADPALATPVAADDPDALTLTGAVFDGAGAPVPDAVVETWQWGGPFARCATDADGRWRILTVKPGPVPGPGGAPQAPHVDLSVFARGLLNRVVTRLYFGDEPEANAADPVLSGLGEGQRATLVAEPGDDGYRFDVHLQGARETTFFTL